MTIFAGGNATREREERRAHLAYSFLLPLFIFLSLLSLLLLLLILLHSLLNDFYLLTRIVRVHVALSAYVRVCAFVCECVCVLVLFLCGQQQQQRRRRRQFINVINRPGLICIPCIE